ncbi:hypothetical protein Mgra_00007997 [Meloidogyne graminicola]|uniref:Uncharacterized protein n=1 Tax=Meloidogyne graminicola TaxID=189291 RepID=A0A8S9ZH23_9BILA|nr:hypothetical protein Mgra_00007997 [Meloidogyne graminicola]
MDGVGNIGKALEKKMKPFIDLDKFKCWTILRLFGDYFWSQCEQITYAKKSIGHGDLRGIITLNYNTTGSLFELCEVFSFHLIM